ncbi:MAG: XRE family transcriptional regulator [Pirellulales bacterium]
MPTSTGSTTIAERLRARARQLGLSGTSIAELAGVNRSFVYDILSGRSERPGLDRLEKIAAVLKVEATWLLNGIGEVEGEPPLVENPDLAFVAIPYVNVRSSVGGSPEADSDPNFRRPYHFQRGWIRHSLNANPVNLRIMHVEGDSMMPTLIDGDVVLVDISRRSPSPPGIFVINDGMGLVAKRLEHIPNSEPARVRIISDNQRYSDYDGLVDAINVIGRICWFSREV